MRLTERDTIITRDVALSHVMSRDQLITLYFGSVTRANSRLRGLVKLGLLKRLDTPFFSQSLYAATKRAAEIVGVRIAPLLTHRAESPGFLQHALMVTEARLALKKRNASEWRFEPQLWASVHIGKTVHQVRPDGMAIIPGKGAIAVELDLGHVAPQKFAEKLRVFDHFIAAGEAKRVWGTPEVRLLTLTTGPLRAKHLARLTPPNAYFVHVVETFATFDLPTVGSWS
jgi:hypothetical protein